MSRKTIPEQVEIYCDRCGDRCIANNYKHRGHVVMECNAADIYWQYSPVPPQSYDLCDSCVTEFTDFIRGLSVEKVE